MKLNTKLAKRYAKGLYNFIQLDSEKELVYNQMLNLEKVIDSSKELRSFLNSLILDYKKKLQIADLIFEKYDQSVKTFIKLIIKHKREIYLNQIAKAYINLYQSDNNYKIVQITTAYQLDSSTIENIYKNKNFIDSNSKVILEHNIDSSLIGGYILRVADKQIDASIKNKLATIKKDFNNNYYIPKF